MQIQPCHWASYAADSKMACICFLWLVLLLASCGLLHQSRQSVLQSQNGVVCALPPDVAVNEFLFLLLLSFRMQHNSLWRVLVISQGSELLPVLDSTL